MPKFGRGSWGLLCVALALIAAGVGLYAMWPTARSQAVVKAAAAYERGDWTGAYAAARERLKDEPNDLEAMRLLARSAARLGRDESALGIYRRFERSARAGGAPEDPTTRAVVERDQRDREGRSLASNDPMRGGSDRTETAPALFQGGIVPLEAEDYYLLGLMLNRQGYPKSARQLWEQGRSLDPSNAGILEELTRFYAKSDELTPAAEAAEHLAQLSGYETRGDLMLGMIRFEQGDCAAAAERLARALKRDPKAIGASSPPVQYRKALARAFLRTGRPGPAREQLLQVLKDGADPEASWLLSRAALQLGDRAEAATALEQSGPYRDEFPLTPEPAVYVGAARCRECHAAIYNSQQSSLHAKTFFRASDLMKLPFPAHAVADRGDPKVLHTIKPVNGEIQFETQVANTTYRAIVDYAFGSGDRGLTLVGHDQAGQSRELRLSHYSGDSVWDVTSGHFPHPKYPEGFLGEALRDDDVRRCFICHTTEEHAAREKIQPVAADHAIGCERCHGPGGNHVKAVEAKLPDLAIANPSRASGEQVVALCGQCHSPRGKTISPADPTSVRSQGTTLTWSRCYTESDGALSCVTCHNPHRNADTSAKHYESKCLSCHSTTAAASAKPAMIEKDRHARTCPVNPASGCIACHMPVVKDVIPHSPFTDHHIRVHPKPSGGQ